MIEARRLRTGNAVWLRVGDRIDKTPRTVTEIHSGKPEYAAVKLASRGNPADAVTTVEWYLEPIPLTREALAACGWKQNPHGAYTSGDGVTLWDSNYAGLSSEASDFCWMQGDAPERDGGNIIAPVRYLHELQNILMDTGHERQAERLAISGSPSAQDND